MARTFKRHSRKRHHGTRNKRHRTGKNNRMIKKGFNTIKSTSKKGFNTVKSTSRKYMPAVKTGLEGVGSKVTKTASKSVPILQKTTRDLFGIFGLKKKGKY
jgi:hypothetical protein